MTGIQRLCMALASVSMLSLQVACSHVSPVPDVTVDPPPTIIVPAAPAAPADPDAGAAAPDAAADTSADAQEGLHKPKEMNHFVEVVTFRGDIDPKSVEALIDVFEKANASQHDPKQDPVEAVVFVYDTNGGQMQVGADLIDAMQALEMPLVCVVNGSAYSMGMLILQAGCPVRLMTSHSALMAHEPHLQGEVKLTLSDPDRLTFQGIADEMQASFRGWVNIMAKRMHMPAGQLLENIRGQEWFLDPDEAQVFHAVDAVVDNITRDVVRPLEDNLRLPRRLGVPPEALQAPGLALPEEALAPKPPTPALPARRSSHAH